MASTIRGSDNFDTAGGNAVKAWVNLNGATPAIRASFNVSSITDNGVGDFSMNFSTAMPDADYCVQGIAESSSDSTGVHTYAIDVTLFGNRANYITASAVRMKVAGGVPAYSVNDCTQIHFVVFR